MPAAQRLQEILDLDHLHDVCRLGDLEKKVRRYQRVGAQQGVDLAGENRAQLSLLAEAS